MASRAFRIKKSRSMLISLYSLAGLAALSYLVLTFVAAINLMYHFSTETMSSVFLLLQTSLIVILKSTLFSLPFAGALSFLISSEYNLFVSKKLTSFLGFIDEAPIILYGLFFVFFLGGDETSLLLTCMMLVIPKLSNRWIKLSNRVSEGELEVVQSLGLHFWKVFSVLYVGRFGKTYLGHLFSVGCFLFGAVTPFLCFISFRDSLLPLFSLQLFSSLGLGSSETSLMVFIVLLIHSFRVWFDTKTLYNEVENG